MARVAADDAGPSAFDVQLSISTGRTSPDCESVTIKVNAGSTIKMVFMNGAYILRDKHGRDMDTLLKDFDLYLVRPERDDIVLNPSREIADYGIKRNEPMDQLQFRHKTLPIPIVINLCDGEDRKIEVNFGFPLMDVVPTICDMFGIKEHAELSLARPTTNTDVKYEWLSLTSSLNGQDVQDGDKLLLRKKFFILNDDIHEAVKGNDDLRELIYQQIRTQYLTGKYVGGCHEDDSLCSLMSALLHHIEQRSENISDDEATCKVMPQARQKDSSFFAQIVTTFYRERVESLEQSEAKNKLLQLHSVKQTVLVNYYPIKLSEDSSDHVIIIDSDSVSLCQTDDNGKLQAISDKTWRIRDLRDTDISSQNEDLFKVNVLGSWQSLYSPYRQSLSSHLLEAVHLTKLKGLRFRVSARVTSPEVNEVFKRNSHLYHGDVTVKQLPVAAIVNPITLEAYQPPPPGESSVDPPPVDTTMNKRSLSFEWPANNEEAETREVRNDEVFPVLDSPSAGSEGLQSAVIHPVSTVDTEIEFNVSPKATPLREEKKKDLSRTSVHIPDFLELDYRQILEDYKLFHIVVMKQDVRPVLLHTGKAIGEVVKDICGTFSISDPSDYYLWIPTGIQSIIEKYGGKPRILAGRYRRRSSPVFGDFTPRMESNKSLREQYDFSIKPYVLHLRMYQNEDEVDAPDESSLDCGDEWPDCEHPDVARYRRFYQSWLGLVQGAYPVDRKAAIKLNALLTQVYFGDRERARVWPPQDYDAKTFLPQKFHGSFGIVGEVERAHKELSGASTHECINDLIDSCQKLITHQGVFFDVTVPVRREILAVIPWRKMEHRWFGINQHGICSVEQDTGKVLFTHRFSDIYKWTSTENSFKLNFKEWAEDFHGYTYQTKEILNTLELYIQMTIRGRIDQAPSKPPSISSGPDTGYPLGTPPTTPVRSSLNGFDLDQPEHSTPPTTPLMIRSSLNGSDLDQPNHSSLSTSPTTPVMSPLNDSIPDQPKRSSISTPTTYDL
ncbi:uncharacterized protein LOC135344565 [Halichondria panicea]|uniref:uncharacterized protein LOC135344565 n=1 Tax=Halichondria panicea TaxID=6063 RepID=UPI00312BA7D8